MARFNRISPLISPQCVCINASCIVLRTRIMFQLWHYASASCEFVVNGQISSLFAECNALRLTQESLFVLVHVIH